MSGTKPKLIVNGKEVEPCKKVKLYQKLSEEEIQKLILKKQKELQKNEQKN
jgi:hypothetical protein